MKQHERTPTIPFGETIGWRRSLAAPLLDPQDNLDRYDLA
jgi:hypothetical protein